MDAFYALARLDYEVLAVVLDFSAVLRRPAAAREAPLTLLDVACGSGKFPEALVAHTELGALDAVRYDLLVLSAEHARQSGVAEPWKEGNEAWWDWYLSLAADDAASAELVEVPPPAPVAEPNLENLRAELGTLLALFALSPRLGRLAADLLGVEEARIYHDNVLSKSRGCGRTPWHFDAHHFPVASEDIVTSWIALQAIPAAMGPLAFAPGSDTWKLADDVPFDAEDSSYDRGVAQAFANAGVRVDDTPFALGEVSFHHAWCFHHARANATTQPRAVLATTYFADGARLVDHPTMVSGDFEKFLPGARPGDVIDTPLNPIVSR